MTSNLTSIKFRPSKSLLLICIVICLCLNLCIKFSVLSPWLKLAYSSGCILGIYCIYFYIFQKLSIDKCDILFEIQTIICWKDNKMEMYTIDSCYALANLCIFISISNHNNNKILVFTHDSCDAKYFNAIMRRIKWHK